MNTLTYMSTSGCTIPCLNSSVEVDWFLDPFRNNRLYHFHLSSLEVLKLYQRRLREPKLCSYCIDIFFSIDQR